MPFRLGQIAMLLLPPSGLCCPRAANRCFDFRSLVDRLPVPEIPPARRRCQILPLKLKILRWSATFQEDVSKLSGNGARSSFVLFQPEFGAQFQSFSLEPVVPLQVSPSERKTTKEFAISLVDFGQPTQSFVPTIYPRITSRTLTEGFWLQPRNLIGKLNFVNCISISKLMKTTLAKIPVEISVLKCLKIHCTFVF